VDAHTAALVGYSNAYPLFVIVLYTTMSVKILIGRRAPFTNGWTIVDPGTPFAPREYSWVAYQHPDSPTTIFGAEAGVAELDEQGRPYHYEMITAVNDLTIPPKPDRNLWAIPRCEFQRLQMLERVVSDGIVTKLSLQFWADHARYQVQYPAQGEDAAIRQVALQVASDTVC
jgi:hypothetical protein